MISTTFAVSVTGWGRDYYCTILHLYKPQNTIISCLGENNKKTFPIKMKEDVGMSKPKKHVNKVRWDPKLNKPLPYNPT